jgi:ribosomal protein S18 acetylase RimI-like enzyme
VDELTFRAFQETDTSAVTDLFNIMEAAAGGHPGMTEDDTLAQCSTTVRDREADTRVAVTPDGAVVAIVAVPTPPPGGFRVDLTGGVHPDWRGRGLGRQLLQWQLDRAAAIHGEVAPEAHWEAHADAILEDESALRLYQRFGMTPQRYWFEMVAPTTPAPQAALPEGLTVRPYSPDLEKDLYAAHMEAFDDHWRYQRREFHTWVAMTVRSDGFLADLTRVAFDGDEIAGYVLAYGDAVPGWCYLGQVGTRRPWRRRGLAGALLADVLGAAGRAGLTKALLSVDASSPTGAVGVYERVGFEVEHRAVTYAVTELPTA